MDTSIKREEESTKAPTDAEVATAMNNIRRCLRVQKFCYSGDLRRRNSSDSPAAFSMALSRMVQSREVRQREDEVEHDWEYSLRNR